MCEIEHQLCTDGKVITKMSKFDPCAPPAFTHGVCAQSLPDVIQWGTFCQHGFQYREM